MTLQTVDGLAEAAHAAAQARADEQAADLTRQQRDAYEDQQRQALDELRRLIGEHDAAKVELYYWPDFRQWVADIAGLACILDFDCDHVPRWRGQARHCEHCQQATPGPVLLSLADIGEALTVETPWPHDCPRPARVTVSLPFKLDDLADWLNDRLWESPTLEVLAVVPSREPGRHYAVVKIPAHVVRADVDGF